MAQIAWHPKESWLFIWVLLAMKGMKVAEAIF